MNASNPSPIDDLTPSDEMDDGLEPLTVDTQPTAVGDIDTEEQQRLSRRARQGDRVAREQLILSNLALVFDIARRYASRGIPFEDLVQEGVYGLVKAVDNFDPDRGVRFGTYATHWIDGEIRHCVRTQARVVRIPQKVMRELAQLESARREIEQRQARPASTDQLAESTGLEESRVIRLLPMLQDAVSLDAPLDEAEGDTFIDSLASEQDDDAEAVVERITVTEFLMLALARLSNRERQVLKQRWGLGSSGAMTLDEIARLHGLSRQRIKQIQDSALARLQRWWREYEAGAPWTQLRRRRRKEEAPDS